MEDVMLIVDENVKTKDGRVFTRLIGGFGEGNPIITVKQVAELLEKQLPHVNEIINRNIKYFTKEEGYIKDLKVIVQNDDNLKVLKILGYTNMQISKSNNIYILSKAGLLLYLKFAEGDKAVELYKNFIEDYFKTKVENEVLKKSPEDELKVLSEEKRYLYGSIVMKSDESKRVGQQPTKPIKPTLKNLVPITRV